MSRERLVRRIEMEARAYVNAKGSSRDAMILGRVYGLLETATKEDGIRRQDPALLLLTLYTAMVGSPTQASVLTRSR